MKNDLTNEVFKNLSAYYQDKKIPKHSYLQQIKCVGLQVGLEISLGCYKEALLRLNNFYECKDKELCNNIFNVLKLMDVNKNNNEQWNIYRNNLSELLYN